MKNEKAVVRVEQDEHGAHITLTGVPDQETIEAIAKWLAELLTR